MFPAANSSRDTKVVQNAFIDLQKKAKTKNIVKEIQGKKSKKEVEEPVRGFIEHYFQTPEGVRVSQTFPPEVFNVPTKGKQKVMTEQEYSQYARTITNPNHTIKDDIEVASNLN